MSTIIVFPPYTIFHASLGYLTIALGVSALLVKIVQSVREVRSSQNPPVDHKLGSQLIGINSNNATRSVWHSRFGLAYIYMCYTLPVTAIFVRPFTVDEEPFNYVGAAIFAMYIGLIFGQICIRAYKFQILIHIPAHPRKLADRSNDAEGEVNASGSSTDEDIAAYNAEVAKVSKTYRWLRTAHIVFMCISLTFCIGAGVSFPFRAANRRYEVPAPK